MVSENILEQIRSRRVIMQGKPKKRPSKPRYPMAIERVFRKEMRAYIRKYIALVKQQLLPKLPALIARAGQLRPDGVRSDAWAEDLAELISSITFMFSGEINNMDKKVEVIAKQVAAYNKADVNRVIRSVLGVDVLASEPWLLSQIEWFITTTRPLIKDLPTKATFQIEQIAQRGLGMGKTYKEIGEEITKQFGIAERRAELIARDQVGTFNAELTMLRQREIGVEKFIWRTAMDERVRPEHEEKEGKTYEWANPPDDEIPGEAINCFPGDSVFNSFDCVNKIFRRWYCGDLSSIVTDNGFIIEATPNHPVLTTRGWVPINQIQVGDEIVGALSEAFDGVKVDEHYRKSTFKDCFNTFSKVFGTRFALGSHNNFHGDVSADETVDIIDIDCELSDKVDIMFLEKFCEFILAWAETRRVSEVLSSDSRLLASLFSSVRIPAGIVSSFHQFFSIVARCESHTILHTLRSGSWFNTILDQPVLYDVEGNLISFRKFFNTKSASVEFKQLMNRQLYKIMWRAISETGLSSVNSIGAETLAQIVSANSELSSNFLNSQSAFKERYRVSNNVMRKFTGHVFNLETVNNYYGISAVELHNQCSLVVHNCRCIAEPLLDELLEKI